MASLRLHANSSQRSRRRNLRVQFLVALRSAAEPLLMQRFAGRVAALLGDNRVVLPPPPRRRAAGAPHAVRREPGRG
jgi:hypothetical protein